MNQIRVTSTKDGSEHCFDDSELSACYTGAFDAAGGVSVSIDLYRGAELVFSTCVQRFDAAEVDGFDQR